jgi:hypothetical protein
MLNLNDISWTTLTQSDVHYLDTNNGMPTKVMLNIVSKWNWQKSILRVYDIKFKNGHPHYVRIVGFTDYNDRSMEEFLEFMFDVSLTHKVMFVDEDGRIFITESDDGQTNIDADLMEDMLNAYV